MCFSVSRIGRGRERVRARYNIVEKGKTAPNEAPFWGQAIADRDETVGVNKRRYFEHVGLLEFYCTKISCHLSKSSCHMHAD